MVTYQTPNSVTISCISVAYFVISLFQRQKKAPNRRGKVYLGHLLLLVLCGTFLKQTSAQKSGSGVEPQYSLAHKRRYVSIVN